MSDLITIKDGEPVTSTLAIAAGTATTHEAVIKLVRIYTADLEEFGRVRFEIQPFETAGGEQKREVATLNEEQSSLLISYMKNTKTVRTFKKALIRGFYDMRAKLRAAPADMLAGLPPEQRALVAAMVDNAAIKAEQAAQAQVQALQADSIKRIEAKQSAFENGAAYFTVIGYATLRGIKLSVAEASAMGRKAAALSKQNRLGVDKVRDPRFGVVGSYHESMLDKALEALHGGM